MAEKEPSRRCGQNCKRKSRGVAPWKPKEKSFSESVINNIIFYLRDEV